MKDIGLAALSLALVVGVGLGAYKFFLSPKEPEATQEVKIEKVEGFGKTPQEAVAKYIYTAGNIGNPDDVNIGKLTNGTARNNNLQRRIDAYDESVDALVSDGPSMGIKKSDLEKYTGPLQWAEYYVVPKESIKVSENIGEFKDESTDGKPYEGQIVKASFESEKVYFRLKAQDSSSDGTFVKVSNKQQFDNVEFKVAKVGDNAWKIFSINDNGAIGPRFAHWSPEFSKKAINPENDKPVGELKPDKAPEKPTEGGKK